MAWLLLNQLRESLGRSKVAVESYDDRLDVVAACVGSSGSKIRDIVKELGNEVLML